MTYVRWLWFRFRVWVFNGLAAALLPGQKNVLHFKAARGARPAEPIEPGGPDANDPGAAVSVQWRRMRLRREDGRVFLDRWGPISKRWGGVFLHHITAPDPGDHLHDHPWTFVSIVLLGSYVEQRAPIRDAAMYADFATRYESCTPGVEDHRPWLSVRRMRLDECHQITAVYGRAVWTLCFVGPTRRPWGFYLPTGWVHEKRYDATVLRPMRTEIDR